MYCLCFLITEMSLLQHYNNTYISILSTENYGYLCNVKKWVFVKI